MEPANHPFDQAIALTPLGPGHWSGHTSAAYWNMIGPFGDITAATVLRTVLQHAQCLVTPVALTVNYAAALQAGTFNMSVRAARTNRSTQHWVVEITQDDHDAQAGVVLTATVMTAVRRDTWGICDTPMPQVPGPQDVSAPAWRTPIEWIKRYEVVQLQGPLPHEWDDLVSTRGFEDASLSRLWMRDAPSRPLDYCAVGDGFVLGQARAHAFHAGFHDQSAQLWSATGALLATSHQMVYYKR